MKRAHCVATGACTQLRSSAGALMAGLALVWIVSAPGPAWGQWTGGPTGPIYYNGGNVGIGTTSPLAALNVVGTSATNNIPVVASIIQGQAAGSPATGEGVQQDFYTKFDVGALKVGSLSFVPDSLNTVGNYGSTFKMYLSGGFGGGTPSMYTVLTLNQENGTTLGGVNLGQGAVQTPVDAWDVGQGLVGAGVTHVVAADAKTNSSEYGSTNIGPAYDFYITDANWQKRIAYIGALTSGSGLTNAPTADLLFSTVQNGTESEKMRIAGSGKVGIGTTNPQYLLSVNGQIGAKDVIVTNTGWSDYVFQPGYRLRPLSEVNAYIEANHHLPDIPSAAEVQEKGVGIGDMQSKLLAKIEELTLHMIQQDKENRDLRERIAQLEAHAAGNGAPAAGR